MVLISKASTEALSYHPETGGVHTEGKTYPDIHLAAIAIQELFGNEAKRSIKLTSQFKMILPSPDLLFTASQKEIDIEIELAERYLGALGFFDKNSVSKYRPLLREVRKVYKNEKPKTEFDNLLLRPRLVSAWLVGTKKIVEKRSLDLLSQILIEKEFEINYLEHAWTILDYLEIHLETYSQINDLRKIRGLMFSIKDLLLNPYKLVAAPYKQAAQQASDLIKETNISEPQVLYERQFKASLKEITNRCLRIIDDGLRVQTPEAEFS